MANSALMFEFTCLLFVGLQSVSELQVFLVITISANRTTPDFQMAYDI